MAMLVITRWYIHFSMVNRLFSLGESPSFLVQKRGDQGMKHHETHVAYHLVMTFTRLAMERNPPIFKFGKPSNFRFLGHGFHIMAKCNSHNQRVWINIMGICWIMSTLD